MRASPRVILRVTNVSPRMGDSEQDAVAGVEAVGFPVVDRDPVGVDLRRRVRRARIERRRLALRGLEHLAEHLRARGLVEARVLDQPADPDRLEQAQRAERVGVGRVLGRLERDGDVALGGEVVDLVGAHLLDDPDQVRRVRHVAVVQDQPRAGLVRIRVQMVDPVRVEQRRPALDAVDLVALLEQKLGEIGAVLARDSRDQRALQLRCLPSGKLSAASGTPREKGSDPFSTPHI